MLTTWATKQGLRIGVGGTITGGFLALDGVVDTGIVISKIENINSAGEQATGEYCKCDT